MRTRRSSEKITVSIEDVARESGVSPATVSRVINKFSSVKEKNRKAVLATIKKLKFQPSVFARRLAKGKSDVVALVIPRYEGVFYSFYVLELIRGIGTLCDALKLDLLLKLTSAESALNYTSMGGIIFADIIGNQCQLSNALEQGIPCVVINNYIKEIGVSCISIDNVKGAKEAVNYLAGLGHKRIAHISGDLTTQAARQRLEGYKKGLKINNIDYREDYVVTTDYSRGKARWAAHKLLELKEAPSAIFVASDSMALETMTVARELGKSVPRDISLIGFDDNPSGLYAPVALTTIRQPLVKMAEDSVKELNRLMSSSFAKPAKNLLPCELVIRESCASVR
ncbi:MAG: LacI family transcriptional regulator [Candidatus Omnitrophica bacterium]|nr:LacI family transcriptional regulator [Candidatus Omnitrophota bacterium]MBU1871940.1 LacI family transcriptional regulator [Candidatus Omnitrophota bacterium]